ncbi:MAG: hypothetical protein PHT07_07800 [Paludibacter sp.]|nr:hypothetical protein [Paludibacter sp.]
MKKDGIIVMLIGLGLTLLTAVFYTLNLNEIMMDKFVFTIGSSFHFNWAPMIGISIMAFGEFVLWQSQNNKNLKEAGIRYFEKLKMGFSNIKLEAIYLSHLKFLNMKVIRFMISIFHI